MIECCGHKQKSVAYMCDPPKGFLLQRVDYLVWCKHCKRTIMQVTRLDLQHRVSSFRRSDADAEKLFDKLRTSILYKIKEPRTITPTHGSFWLGYNEFGHKKRCYSNLSALKTTNDSLPLPTIGVSFSR